MGRRSAQVVVVEAGLELLAALEAVVRTQEVARLSRPRGARAPGHDTVAALVPVVVPAAAAAEAFGSSPIRTTTSWLPGSNSVDAFVRGPKPVCVAVGGRVGRLRGVKSHAPCRAELLRKNFLELLMRNVSWAPILYVQLTKKHIVV